MYRELELDLAPPVAVEPSARPRDLRLAWPLLLERVRRGAPGAFDEFRELCRPGVRLLLKLNLSAVGIEQLVEETIAGAAEEMRRGWICDPGDLAAFIREVIRRNATAQSLPGATDQARARTRATGVENALRRFPPEQRVWLTRFYVDGWDVARICLASGLTEDEFAVLRRELRRAAGLMPSLAGAGPTTVAPKVRAAGAA